MAAQLQLAGDQVDLDDFCAPERHKVVTCHKQTGNQQACTSQANSYSACQHHFLREVAKMNTCKVPLAQFDACRTENGKRDCKDLAKNVYNCYQKL